MKNAITTPPPSQRRFYDNAVWASLIVGATSGAGQINISQRALATKTLQNFGGDVVTCRCLRSLPSSYQCRLNSIQHVQVPVKEDLVLAQRLQLPLLLPQRLFQLIALLFQVADCTAHSLHSKAFPRPMQSQLLMDQLQCLAVCLFRFLSVSPPPTPWSYKFRVLSLSLSLFLSLSLSFSCSLSLSFFPLSLSHSLTHTQGNRQKGV